MQNQSQQPQSPSASQPSMLNDIRIDDPHTVIQEFFAANRLQEVGDLLYFLLEKSFASRPTPAINEKTGGYDPGGIFNRLKAIKATLAASSLIHQVANQQPGIMAHLHQSQRNDVLEEIIGRILKVLQADKIYLITRDTDQGKPRFQLLICIPKKRKVHFPRYEKKIRVSCADIALLSVHIQYSEELFVILKNGHIFYSPICTPEQLIYDSNRVVFATFNPQRADMVAEETKRSFDNIYQKAKFFLEAPRLEYSSAPRPELLFNLHQAIEHTCHAIIDTFSENHLYSNNLFRLLVEANRYIPGLSNRICSFPDSIELLQQSHFNTWYRVTNVTTKDWNTVMSQTLLFVNDTQIAFRKKLVEFTGKFGAISPATT